MRAREAPEALAVPNKANGCRNADFHRGSRVSKTPENRPKRPQLAQAHAHQRQQRRWGPWSLGPHLSENSSEVYARVRVCPRVCACALVWFWGGGVQRQQAHAGRPLRHGTGRHQPVRGPGTHTHTHTHTITHAPTQTKSHTHQHTCTRACERARMRARAALPCRFAVPLCRAALPCRLSVSLCRVTAVIAGRGRV